MKTITKHYTFFSSPLAEEILQWFYQRFGHLPGGYCLSVEVKVAQSVSQSDSLSLSFSLSLSLSLSLSRYLYKHFFISLP